MSLSNSCCLMQKVTERLVGCASDALDDNVERTVLGLVVHLDDPAVQLHTVDQ